MVCTINLINKTKKKTDKSNRTFSLSSPHKYHGAALASSSIRDEGVETVEPEDKKG
jgi:hypothetical protein